MGELFDILKEFRPDIDFESQTDLITGGILDSLDIVNIISELDSTFDIEIPVEEVTPENFASAHTMWALIQRVKEEG